MLAPDEHGDTVEAALGEMEPTVQTGAGAAPALCWVLNPAGTGRAHERDGRPRACEHIERLNMEGPSQSLSVSTWSLKVVTLDSRRLSTSAVLSCSSWRPQTLALAMRI
mmetsp:Transcript_82014/g.211349  ORF Transcript_82014/g.211349 Transcript_82014/m.211349 type:complete len:109 (-) Transcript_82014:55-381(-)